MNRIDYYEFLQISPNAELETINRVYRFLAIRLHPDNRKTGDLEKFLLLKKAHDVLSDPTRRAEYDAAYNDAAYNDAAYENESTQAAPLCTWVDFMDNIEGELNRRLAVLGLLYIRRRTHPNNPEVSLMTLEKSMGFPRDYLDFTTWYLKNKELITKSDNVTFTLTVQGVDFVESNRERIPVLNRLLTGPATTDEEEESELSAPPGSDVWHHPRPSEGIRASRQG